MSLFLLSWSRSGRSSLGFPGRGVCSAGQHRTLQQSPLRQEPQQPGLPARGQLPAKRSRTAGGPARGLSNELRPLAGAGGFLQTYILGRTATVRISDCQHPHTWNKMVSIRNSDKPPTVVDYRSQHYVTCSVQTEGDGSVLLSQVNQVETFSQMHYVMNEWDCCHSNATHSFLRNRWKTSEQSLAPHVDLNQPLPLLLQVLDLCASYLLQTNCRFDLEALHVSMFTPNFKNIYLKYIFCINC